VDYGQTVSGLRLWPSWAILSDTNNIDVKDDIICSLPNLKHPSFPDEAWKLVLYGAEIDGGVTVGPVEKSRRRDTPTFTSYQVPLLLDHVLPYYVSRPPPASWGIGQWGLMLELYTYTDEVLYDERTEACAYVNRDGYAWTNQEWKNSTDPAWTNASWYSNGVNPLASIPLLDGGLPPEPTSSLLLKSAILTNYDRLNYLTTTWDTEKINRDQGTYWMNVDSNNYLSYSGNSTSSWADAKSEAAMNVVTSTSSYGPIVGTRGTYNSDTATWAAYALSRQSALVRLGFCDVIGHDVSFYSYALTYADTNGIFDDNGFDVVETNWFMFDNFGLTTNASVTSSVIGQLTIGTWCDAPTVGTPATSRGFYYGSGNGDYGACNTTVWDFQHCD